MQVAAGRTAGVAAQAKNLTGIDTLVLFHQRTRQVTIDRLQTVVVTDKHVVAVASRIPSYDAHLTVPRRTKRVAHLHFHIRPVMETVAAETEVRGHMCQVLQRIDESFQRHGYAVLQAVNRCLVRVDARVHP